MATGYTADIANDISFEKFVMNCARAFGACITMRDDPKDVEIPEFEPSMYHAERLREAKEELDSIKRMSLTEATHLATEEFKSNLEFNIRAIDNSNTLRKKYLSMLAKVKKWKSPSSEHDNMKKFMCKQVNDSMEHDCDTQYYYDNAPKILSGKEWGKF